MKQSTKAKKPDGRKQIHNVRFYKIKPRSIQCMAHNKIFNMLALSRSDGTIEIWDMQYAPYLERVIPSTPGDSVEGLVWAGQRLFSVGLTGELVEWNLRSLKPRRKQLMTGNALWCIDRNRAGTELAVGTEEGFINIMSIEDDDLIYKTLFDKQEGRVLCCSYDASGDFLVTGSMGAVRIWNVHTGHALHKMKVSHVGKRDVIVWSLKVLTDFSIITGDSAGFVTVWDGHTAAQVESFKVLHADVLTVAVNEAEDLLMCSGIEPLIRIFAKTQIKREEMVFHRWVKFLQRSVHDHDVKSLLCVGDRMLSGGMDGYLTISSASRTRSDAAKYVPQPQQPCASHSATSNLLLLRYTNYMELWRLGSIKPATNVKNADGETDDLVARKHLPLKTLPEKLLLLKSINNAFVLCAAISPDGKWLCYSTQNEIRVFRYQTADNVTKTKAALTRIITLPEEFGPASQLHFTDNSSRILLVKPETKQLVIFSLNDEEIQLVETIELGKFVKDNVSHLIVSKCSTYIIVADANHTIAVWSLNNGKHYVHHLNLPRYMAATTALAVHEETPHLVAAFADGKIFEYDLEEMCFTCSTSDHHIENTTTHCIRNIVLDAKNPDIFVLHNDKYLFVLEKVKPTATPDDEADADEQTNEYNLRSSPRKKLAKRAKTVERTTENKVCGLRLKLQLNYEHLMHLSRLSPNELIAVGVDADTLIEQLPNPYRQKKFGVS